MGENFLGRQRQYNTPFNASDFYEAEVGMTCEKLGMVSRSPRLFICSNSDLIWQALSDAVLIFKSDAP